jgi:hypothetical protein
LADLAFLFPPQQLHPRLPNQKSPRHKSYSSDPSKLSSAKLSYWHSSGKLENQAQFIEALVSGASDFSKVAFENQIIQAKKDIAIVRHNLAADVLDVGNSNSIKIGVILVWQKE